MKPSKNPAVSFRPRGYFLTGHGIADIAGLQFTCVSADTA